MKQIAILINPTGQTSNHLFQHIHFLSYFVEKEIIFINHRYQDFYFRFKPNNVLVFLTCILNTIAMRKVLVFFGFASQYYFGNQNFFQKKEKFENDKSKIIYVAGGNLKYDHLVLKYRYLIVSVFKTFYLKDHPFRNDITKNNSIKLAVHIRRQDYRDYKSGLYFYDDAVYVNFITQFIELIDGKLEIIFFSDDTKLNIASFHLDKLSSVVGQYLSQANIWQDYALMSSCDFILGPPSTFSKWASFIGSKPLYVIRNPNEKLVDLNQFVCINA